jgi:Zn-dependent alcohol dehydrogenase
MEQLGRIPEMDDKFVYEDLDITIIETDSHRVMKIKVIWNKQEEVIEDVKPARKVKVGVIGCGGISYAHFNNYKKMDDVEIVAIADLIPEQMETKAQEFGLPDTVRRYNNHIELVDNEPDLDVVSICTYNSQHAAPAICALTSGLGVHTCLPVSVVEGST